MMSQRYDAVEATLHVVLDDQSPVLGYEGDALAECLLTLAEARRLAERYRDAQAALDAASEMCDDRGLHAVRARVRAEQAALYAAAGRFREAYEEHRAFHAAATALHSTQREARARALQAVFEATEARRASEHFREMAHRDALTGLYNRRYVNEKLPALLGEAAVRPGAGGPDGRRGVPAGVARYRCGRGGTAVRAAAPADPGAWLGAGDRRPAGDREHRRDHVGGRLRFAVHAAVAGGPQPVRGQARRPGSRGRGYPRHARVDVPV
jgi:hypothetical protein